MSQKPKRKRGDRKDGVWIRESDPLHVIMPYLMLGRADNEGVFNGDFDMTEALRYLDKKNESCPDFKYTMFHLVMAALAKTIYHRPAMNRFMQGHRLYQRNDISFSFVVKRALSDKGEEALVIMNIDTESGVSPMEQIYSRVKKEVNHVRRGSGTNQTMKAVGLLSRIPRPLLRLVAKILFWLEYHGWVPDALVKIDPYHTTCFISNLGSIKMTASYHHLINWGTNSLFLVIGEKKAKPVYTPDGSFEMKEMLPLSFTIDERIADGFYFAKSIKLLENILLHPEILDEPIQNPIEY